MYSTHNFVPGIFSLITFTLALTYDQLPVKHDYKRDTSTRNQITTKRTADTLTTETTLAECTDTLTDDWWQCASSSPRHKPHTSFNTQSHKFTKYSCDTFLLGVIVTNTILCSELDCACLVEMIVSFSRAVHSTTKTHFTLLTTVSYTHLTLPTIYSV